MSKLTEMIERVMKGERVVLTNQGVDRCAVISMADFQRLEAAEEQQDLRTATEELEKLQLEAPKMMTREQLSQVLTAGQKVMFFVGKERVEKHFAKIDGSWAEVWQDLVEGGNGGKLILRQHQVQQGDGRWLADYIFDVLVYPGENNKEIEIYLQ